MMRTQVKNYFLGSFAVTHLFFSHALSSRCLFNGQMLHICYTKLPYLLCTSLQMFPRTLSSMSIYSLITSWH